ncbi:MAG: SDR family NAD(P)-dependent oxidoreductase [Patescibacteria group bacterium]
MNLVDKIILVTGAGSGIGRELTLSLLKKGTKVIAVDIDNESLEETKKLAGLNSENITTQIINIADKKAVENLPEKIKNIDGIVNNAGIIQPFVKINDLDYESIERVMNINFYGTLYMTKAFLPLLLKRPEAYIVNISSMGGFLPVPGQSIYGASKAAVKLMTEGLYAELADTNVHVTVVFPGATKTNITVNSGLDQPKGGSENNFPMLPAKNAANLIVKGIENNKFQVFLGKDCKSMNFLYRLNPRFATNFIAKQMRSLLTK